VALIDVDPEFFPNSDSHLPRAKKILEKQKLDWPNAIAPNGLSDVARVFNVSGYGKILVDGRGIVRGVNVPPANLDQLIAEALGEKKGDKPKR
jgi:hypothetical protein